MALIADIRESAFENIGYDCKEGDVKWKDYFTECGRETKNSVGGRARVVRVLKSTYKLPSGENFVPKGGWEPMWDDQIPLDKSLINKDMMEQTGKIGPIIDENCHQYYVETFLWRFSGPQSMFCHELMKFLFENRVPEKRFCLYEMPETKGFLNKTKE